MMDKLNILGTLNTYGVRIPLRRALELAQALYDMHSIRINQVENAAYDRGHRDGQSDLIAREKLVTEMRLGYLEALEEFAEAKAKKEVVEIVKSFGLNNKIRCIKELRESTGLGLKQAKDVVDSHIADLKSRPVVSSYYGDEPPF